MIVDIIVIVVLLLNAVIDYNRGLIMSLYRFFSWGISLIVGSKLYPLVTLFFKNYTPLYENLKLTINSHIASDKITVDTIINLPLPQTVKTAINQSIGDQLNIAKETLVTKIADFGISALSLIVVVILVSLGIKLVVHALDAVSKLPVLNFFNKNLGLIFGLLVGVIQVWVVGIGLTYFAVNAKFGAVFAAIDESILGKYFYNNNVLLNIINVIFK